MKLERTRKAISRASEGDWEGAVEVNKSILEEVPWDLEAYNRLGKAYMELQEAEKAIQAFKCSLIISPNVSIEKKNQTRSKN